MSYRPTTTLARDTGCSVSFYLYTHVLLFIRLFFDIHFSSCTHRLTTLFNNVSLHILILLKFFYIHIFFLYTHRLTTNLARDTGCRVSFFFCIIF